VALQCGFWDDFRFTRNPPPAVDTCHPMMMRYSTYGVTPMTAADFRRIARSLEGVEEYSHAGLPAFRVGGRKFASLASQAEGYGNLMLRHVEARRRLAVSGLKERKNRRSVSLKSKTKCSLRSSTKTSAEGLAITQTTDSGLWPPPV
jgi:hypothetical protein